MGSGEGFAKKMVRKCFGIDGEGKEGGKKERGKRRWGSFGKMKGEKRVLSRSGEKALVKDEENVFV